MKTYQLTIRPERKGRKLESKLLAKGEAENATEFYNQHLQKMIEAVKGFDAGVASVTQIGGPESVSTTVYPDDVVSSNATGEQQVEPAGREGREFDPVKGFFDEMVKKNAPIDIEIKTQDNFSKKCGEAVKNFIDSTRDYKIGRGVIAGARHTLCPHVLGDKRCGVDPAGKDCDKTVTACRDKFNNLEHFGGMPDFNIQHWPDEFRFGFRPQPEHAPYLDGMEKMLMDPKQRSKAAQAMWEKPRTKFKIEYSNMVRSQLPLMDPAKLSNELIRGSIRNAGHDPDMVRILKTEIIQVHDDYRLVVEYEPYNDYP